MVRQSFASVAGVPPAGGGCRGLLKAEERESGGKCEPGSEALILVFIGKAGFRCRTGIEAAGAADPFRTETHSSVPGLARRDVSLIGHGRLCGLREEFRGQAPQSGIDNILSLDGIVVALERPGQNGEVKSA